MSHILEFHSNFRSVGKQTREVHHVFVSYVRNTILEWPCDATESLIHRFALDPHLSILHRHKHLSSNSSLRKIEPKRKRVIRSPIFHFFFLYHFSFFLFLFRWYIKMPVARLHLINQDTRSTHKYISSIHSLSHSSSSEFVFLRYRRYNTKKIVKIEFTSSPPL